MVSDVGPELLLPTSFVWSFFSVVCSAYGNSLVLFRELAALVDRSWRMEMGGVLREELLPFQF